MVKTEIPKPIPRFFYFGSIFPLLRQSGFIFVLYSLALNTSYERAQTCTSAVHYITTVCTFVSPSVFDQMETLQAPLNPFTERLSIALFSFSIESFVFFGLSICIDLVIQKGRKILKVTMVLPKKIIEAFVKTIFQYSFWIWDMFFASKFYAYPKNHSFILTGKN